MNKNDLVRIGSETAKNGFKNEINVVDKFNNWEKDEIAQEWLDAMDYNLSEIEYVKAVKVKGSYKADIQVQISIKLKHEIDCQNMQVKLVSNKKGFNQIDKRWLSKYQELWNIPEGVLNLLKHYTGELQPYKKGTKDNRRMFANEFTKEGQDSLLEFLKKNKTLIVSDILKGRGKFSAEWILVIRKTVVNDWALKPMNVAMNFYSQGDVCISARGTFHIGKITMQRKGGDNGRQTANMLQFKIDPTELFY